MRQITTSKGKTYEVDYAWGPLYDGSCGISIEDNRKLSVIADEFEGLTTIHLVDTDTGEYDFIGYDVLTEISRAGSKVQMKLIQGVTEDAEV